MTDRPPALLGLPRSNLRELAVHALRTAITTGELPPGTHVSEVETAERLRISRGTLREAMRQLQQEGLLTGTTRGRLQVRHMDRDELVDVFAVRGALEAFAARTIAERGDRSAAVAALNEALEAMTLAQEGALDDRIETDLEFHRVLCEQSGNATLVRTWESLEGSIRMSIMFSGRERAAANMDVERHRDLVAAIETGDPDDAAAAVRNHMRDAAQTLID